MRLTFSAQLHLAEGSSVYDGRVITGVGRPFHSRYQVRIYVLGQSERHHFDESDFFATNAAIAIRTDIAAPTREDQRSSAGAKKARTESDIDELRSRLAEMEKAASLIGQAMLRP